MLPIKKLILLISLLFTHPFFIIAQPTYDDQEIIPANPSAAAITKFIDFPMDYYSGTENISIPLENISIGDISVDVNLSYNSGGIKVDQISGDVGVGWNLNAGGIINRTVVDKPDELVNNGYMSLENRFIDYNEIDISSRTQYNFLKLGALDREPDVFSFVAGNYSGKFYFITDGEIAVVPYQDVKIDWKHQNHTELMNNSLYSFTISTPDGFKYTYGADLTNLEWTVSSFSKNCSNKPPAPDPDFGFGGNVVTAWRLKKIESIWNTFVINFTYSTYNSTYDVNYSETLPLLNLMFDETCINAIPPKSECITRMTVRSSILKKISTPNKSLDFTNASSSDVTGGKHYTGITVKGINNTVQKKVQFVSSDVTSTGNVPEDMDNKSYMRRFLDEVQFIDKANTVVNKYVLDYGGKEKILPPRFGFAQDYWGYYNGAASNTASFTDDNSNWKSIISNNYPGYQFADRRANEDFGHYGMLKKITYPTGGYRKYNYECNGYDMIPSGSEILDSFSETCSSNWTFELGASTKTCFFDLPNPQVVTVDYNLTLNALDKFGEGLAASVEIINEVSTAIEFKKDGFGVNNAPPNIVNGSEQVYLSAGTYILKTSVVNKDETARITVKYNEYADPNTLLKIKVGGQRISSIITAESSQATNKIIKNITYGGHKLLASPSPKIDSKHVFYYQDTHFCENCESITLHSSSLYALFNTQGRTIGYNEVKESLPDSGYNIYKFRTYPNTAANTAPIGSDLNLQMAYTDHSYKNGILKTIENYNNSNSLVGSSVYTYKLDNSNNRIKIPGVRVSINGSTDCSVVVNNLADMFEASDSDGRLLTAGWYNYTSERLYLEEKIETLNGVSTTTTYTYDDTKPFMQLGSMKTVNSDNKIYETRYKYYDEYVDDETITNDANIKTWLKTNNIIEPWETTTYVYDNANDTSPTQTDGTRFEYNNFSSSIYYPKTFERYEVTWDENEALDDDGWQNQHVIESYNTNAGKPTSIKVDGWDDSIIYTWTPTGNLNTKTFKDFVTDYNYHSDTDFLSEIIEPDGQKTTFTFDNFMRLNKLESRGGKVKKEYNYSYKPNFIEEISTFNDTGTVNDITNITKSTFDGLGRDIRIDQVGHKWNSPGINISVLKKYDSRGLLSRVYEPDDDVNITASDKYTEYIYHSDLLDRVQSIKDPMSFETLSAFGTNDTEIEGFAAGTLMRETITDADEISTSTYTDKLGRVVASRTFKGTEESITYTNYDDKNRVSTIIPPGASPDDANLIYTYIYDGADNIKRTKFPDKGLMEYQYDDRNLQTAMRDANIKAKKKGWLNSEYDAYGRLHKHGFGNTAGIVTNLLIQNYYDNNDALNVVNAVTPIYRGKLHKSKVNILNGFNKSNDYLTTTYALDSYGRVSSENLTSNHISLAETTAYTYDMADNILTNRHTAGGTVATETFEFDTKGRLQKNDFTLTGKGSKTVAQYTRYSVKDELLSKNIGSKSSSGYLQTVDFAYNHNSWLTTINGGSVTGTKTNCSILNAYASGDLFALDIRYNNAALSNHIDRKNGNISEIYWQVKGRAKNAYRFEYDYLNRLTEAEHYITDNKTGWLNIGYYNTGYSYDERGNITTLSRKGLTGNGTSCIAKQIDNLTYLYQSGTNKLISVFDSECGGVGLRINPITNRTYNAGYLISDAKTNTAGGTNNTKNIQFKANTYISLDQGFSYNVNGNNSGFNALINPCSTANTDLINNGFKGAESSYQYDGNGNLINDSQKQLTISYNHLNLPYKAQKNASNKIEWTYTADGRKLQKKATTNGQAKIKNYLGNMEFTESTNGTSTLEAAYHSEGRVLNNGYWEYNLKDHLGNVRLVFIENTAANNVYITQENHYYPFGMQMNGNWAKNQNVKNDYLYNGKELNTEIGLNWSDYGVPHVTTYNYAENEPIANIDLWGLQSYPYWGEHAKAYEGKKSFTNPKISDWQGEWNTRAALVMVGSAAAVLGGAFGLIRYGAKGVGGFILNEAKDEVASKMTNGASDFIDISKNLKNLAKYGIKKLDIGGGGNSKYSNALNIDPKAESGFKGTLGDFVKQTGGEVKFADIVVDNPQFNFLGEVGNVLEEGGTITVRGTMSNKYFNKIVKGNANGIENFNVSKPVKISNEGFNRTDGTPITGQIYEITLTQ